MGDNEKQAYGEKLEFLHQEYSWTLNLSKSFAEINDLLRKESEQFISGKGLGYYDHGLNVYLFLSALHQVVSDYLIRGMLNFAKIRGRLPQMSFALKWVEKVVASGVRWRNFFFDRRLLSLQSRLAQALNLTSRFLVLMRAGEYNSALALEIGHRVNAILQRNCRGGIAGRCYKLPSSFRNFDLYPEDCFSLAKKYQAAYPDKKQPLLVLGLRTAGGYLAPLCAGQLQVCGFADVEFLTLKLSFAPSFSEQRALKRARRNNHRVLILDDAPFTGDTLIRAHRYLMDRGIKPEQIIFLIPEFYSEWLQNDRLSKLFQLSKLIVLPFHEWKVNELLQREQAEAALQLLLAVKGYEHVRVIEEETVKGPRRRSHLKKLFEVQVHSRRGDEVKQIFAKGAGIGYLGYHGMALASKMPKFFPTVFGIHEGILFTEWIVPQNGSTAAADEGRAKLVTHLGSYIATRVTSLNVDNDHTFDIHSKWTFWHHLAAVLSRSYGFVGYFSRLSLHELLVNALRYDRPSVVDGNIGPEKWLASNGSFKKVDFEEHAFDQFDRQSFDPAYDIAAICYEFNLSPIEEENLISHYGSKSDDRGIRDRLFTYKLLYAAERSLFLEYVLNNRSSEVDLHQSNLEYAFCQRYLNKLVNSYLTGIFSSKPVIAGEAKSIFALDIDGVLEDFTLGFPSTSPAGSEALRILKNHHFTVLLCSGRSLAEMQDRCESYQLSGAVAEYGSVIWDHRHREKRVLISREAQEQLAVLKSLIEKIPYVYLHPDFEFSLRAYEFKSDMMWMLEGERILELIDEHKLDLLTLPPGYLKGDVISKEIDKEKGLLALIGQLGLAGKPVYAMGDSLPDLPMLRAAHYRFTPANATADLMKSGCLLQIKMAKKPSMAGLKESVENVIHGKRSCSVCHHNPELGKEDRLLVDIFRSRDQSRIQRLAHLMRSRPLREFQA